MTYGITDQGFVRKPYTVILAETQAKAYKLFGSDADLSPTSYDGMWVMLMSWSIDRQWQLAEDIYYSLWISTSTGVNLDRTVKFGFISRRAETYALVPLLFKGTNETSIPSGTLCETSNNIVFSTITDAVISSGSVSIVARCQTAGITGMVAAGSITTIKTPISGVDSVINEEASYDGYSQETDAELKERYTDLPSATGSSCDALRTALLKLSGVISVMVFENTSSEIDDDGLPANSFEVVISGGVEETIAQTINQKKPIGIEPYGTTLKYITDSQGLTKLIKFSRPEQVDTYIVYTLTVNSDWSADSIAIMKRNAVKYIGGVDDLLTDYSGVGVGQSVFAWKLTAIQSSIEGIVSIDVTLGKSVSPTAKENLSFLPRELAQTSIDKVIVRVQ